MSAPAWAARAKALALVITLAGLIAVAATPRQESGTDDGLATARELAAELRETAGSAAYGPVVQRAFATFQEDIDALRFEAAGILAETMHATSQASWSAFTLALFRTRAGQYAGARELLLAELDRVESIMPDNEAARSDLLGRLALVELGAGRESVARDHLARALLLGSSDATMVLGWMALRAGEAPRARALFRSLLPTPAEPDPARLLARAPWTLRGYGLASLPAPPAPPARYGR